MQIKFKTNKKIIFLLILVKSPEARFHCSETSEVNEAILAEFTDVTLTSEDTDDHEERP